MLSDTTRPLRRELFRALGRPNSKENLEGHLAELRVGLGVRRLHVVENVILHPSGGIIDANGELLPDGQLRRRPYRKLVKGEALSGPVEATAEIPGEALYLGWFSTHFGHFLIEAMARWWGVRHVDPRMPLLWQTPPNPNVESANRILSMFGLDQHRVSLVSEPTRVRRLVIPDLMLEERHYIHKDAGIPFWEIGERLAGQPALTDQPLYLSRSNLTAPKRRLDQAPLFEAFLASQGWRIVQPERLPIKEQIALIRSHRVIVGPLGSALHSTLFSAHRPSIHTLTTGSPNIASYALTADALDTPLCCIDCATRLETDDPELRGMQLFDIELAAASFHADGLTATPHVPGLGRLNEAHQIPERPRSVP
jgi:hypothetical protein